MKRILLGLFYSAIFAASMVGMPPNLSAAATARNNAVSSKVLLAEASKRWAGKGFKTRIVRVNGVGLHVAEAGKGDLVILLHGYPQSGEIWRSIAPELAKTHHVVIADLRGMGLSEVTQDGYDLSNVAEDIHQLSLSMGYAKAKVVGHDWGAAVGAVYALRYRDEVTKLGFLESVLTGGGFEDLWTFAKPNEGLAFIPFLLMGGPDTAHDTAASLIQGREEIFLHHLWSGFTGDKKAAPFANWKPYVKALARPGVARAGASYYRSAYRSAEQVRTLDARKLEIPVLSIAGEKGIGAAQEAFVKVFASNVTAAIVVPAAGHFVAEERPIEVAAALRGFLAD